MPVDNEFAMDVAVTLPNCEQAAMSGYKMLLQAYRYAMNVEGQFWDFALEIDLVCSAGLSINDLRWLIAKGFMVHGVETTVRGETHRRFQISEGFIFAPSTCVMLTDRGAMFLERFLKEFQTIPKTTNAVCFATQFDESFRLDDRCPDDSSTQSVWCTEKPRWNAAARELKWASSIVKRFRVPARNQETILCVFEEEGWPECIDDPLPIHRGIDPQTRLHDAINRLNRHQTNPLLSFHGNGKGTGIAWKSQVAEFRQMQPASSLDNTLGSGTHERM
ncbi:hypothetical protein RMSM_02710 [Rhodopirellula maiorica SM1]|uniref:Uncharacterized protein n=1 Tax=Rhodopirellula maiorica SM1 TaxID=1265738 RepID=M5RYA1_9BACT|nr:hypothetical protein [Rhodopirellula maiorica]EMI20367.1 hypothetical protein RMSM_02710 [Rhodopirellula maiorica SM1]